ncbi:class C beta-lactamase [Variovorax sp. UMC13]|uniref:class C beta-lactamase n=1 Tax=Variovorax sp. UMC13 TaxID=1862326 RepID=UPI0015FF754F|nr:class C beta-lactamase [Variovorax sp. UMC13]
MPARARLRAGFTPVIGALLFASAALAKAPPPTPPIDEVVREAAHTLMQQNGIPGLAIAVTVDGRQHFFNYGVASKKTQRPVTRDTLFEIGSISKTFTATLASYAQATGRLALTDPPARYLPPLEGSAFGDGTTLMHLGTHTAGGFPLQVPDAVQTTGQLFGYLRTWQPQYPAGTRRTYANPSIGMLGLIAAKSLDMPFEEAMARHVFRPLGLKHTTLDVPAAQMASYAQGYTRTDAPIRLRGGMLGAEAYGVRTSARDLIRFVEANLRGPGTTPLQRAIDATHTGYFRTGVMTQDLVWEQYPYPVALPVLLEGNGDKMAYETQDATPIDPPQPPQQAVWINKTGSTNGFAAYVAFVPAKKIGIVLLANKNVPIAPRVRLAYEILEKLE